MLTAPTCLPTAYTIVLTVIVFPLQNINVYVHKNVFPLRTAGNQRTVCGSQFYRVARQERSEVIMFGDKSLQLLSHLTGHYLLSSS